MRLHNEQKVYVAGHRGLVGSALMRRLAQGGYERIITRTHAELDLCDQTSTHKFLKDEKPDVIIVAAAKVGGIQANNTFRANFIYENLAIANNVIHGAHEADVSTTLLRFKLYLPETCTSTDERRPSSHGRTRTHQ